MATPASASPAPRGPQVLSHFLPSVDAGEAETVSVWFRGTDRRICDFRMVVRENRQVEVSYPRNRRYTTLNTGSTLTRGERDRATFRVETDFRRDANAILTATVSYNDCGRHSRTQFKRFGLLLPVDGGGRGNDHDGDGRGNDNDHKGDGRGNDNDHKGDGRGNDNDHKDGGKGNDRDKSKATAS